MVLSLSWTSMETALFQSFLPTSTPLVDAWPGTGAILSDERDRVDIGEQADCCRSCVSADTLKGDEEVEADDEEDDDDEDDDEEDDFEELSGFCLAGVSSCREGHRPHRRLVCGGNRN